MAAIYKKEIRSLFYGLTGWLSVALILLVFGVFTAVMNLSEGYADFSLVPYNAQITFLIAIPLITMRALAEERRHHTDQLLYSSTLSAYEIVFGKYLAMITVIAIPLAISSVYPLILAEYGRMVLSTAFSAMIAFFMLGAALTAVGLFFSSLSSNQFVSAALCFGVLLLSYFANDLKTLLSTSVVTALYFFSAAALALGALARYMTRSWVIAAIVFAVLEVILAAIYLAAPGALDGSVAAVLNSIAMFARLETFCNGIFDISALLYYLSLAWLFIFFSIQAFEKRRWG